ncbi:MAG: GH3 auxin-responsive promoter family protein [bacterium]|nr:GH3 auxin-responsive promoter family protein [bacterium]
MEQQKKLLMDILAENKDSDYGKRYHFENILTVEAFRGHIPVSAYDDYAPMIELSTRLGESNIITSKPLACYTTALGSFGVPRKIPCTEEYAKTCFHELKDLFCTHGKTVVLFESFPKTRCFKDGKYLNSIYGEMLNEWKKWKKGSLEAKFLSLGSCTSPEELLFSEKLFDQTYVRLLFALQDEDVTQIIAPSTWGVLDFLITLEKEWKQLTEDIEHGTIQAQTELPEHVRELLTKKMKKQPGRAKHLRSIFEQGFSKPVLKEIWPKFVKIIAEGSAGYSNYTDKLKKYIGDVPVDFGCSISAEAMVLKNIQGSDEYRLLPEMGFFEFLPTERESQDTYTMDQLEPGKTYEILLTGRFGFYRYALGNVVRMERYEGDIPILTKGYRMDQTASIAGELMTEQHVAAAVKRLEQQFGLAVYDFCYEPDEEKKCYSILLENEEENGNVIEELEHALELLLEKENPAYQQCIAAGTLHPCKIRFLEEQTQLLYRDVRSMREQLPVDVLLPVRCIDTPIKGKFFFGLAK